MPLWGGWSGLFLLASNPASHVIRTNLQTAYIGLVTTALLVDTVVFLGLIRFWEAKPFQSIGLKPVTVGDLSAALVSGIAASWSIQFMIHSFVPQVTALSIRNPHSEWLTIPLLLRLAFDAANVIAEEVAQRAYIIERVESMTGSLTLAVVASALVCLLGHTPERGLTAPLLLIPGILVLCGLYVWRRSLPACVVAHLIANAVPFGALPLSW